MNNKKLNIAVIVGAFPSVSETFILNQIKYLKQRGHNITIFSYLEGDKTKIHKEILENKLLDDCYYYKAYKGGKRAIFQFFELIKEHFPRINYGMILRSLSFFKYGKDAFTLSLLIKGQFFIRKFDVAHVHLAYNALPFIDLYKEGIIINTPLLISIHGDDLRPGLLDQYSVDYKNLFEFTDRFIVNGFYLNTLLSHIYNKKEAIEIPASLDTKKFIRTTPISNKDAVTIIFCGRLVDCKAPDMAVAIMDELVNKRLYKNVNLRIIGDGVLRELIESQLQEKNLIDHIELLGALTQESVVKEFNNADIFLLPGIEGPETGKAETQGLVIQEAQSMQLPVVVSDVGGMKDGMIDGVTGYVVKQKDISTFADKLELLINSKALREEMGIAGREFVVRNFDIEVLGTKLETSYYNTISENKQAHSK